MLGSYLVWLTGAVVSQVGDAALYFALGWAASAHGGPAAGLVLSWIGLPRTVLLLVGGAVGDRLGACRVPRRNGLRESADGIRVAIKTPGLAAVLVQIQYGP